MSNGVSDDQASEGHQLLSAQAADRGALRPGATHVVHVTECLAGGTLGVVRQLAAELARLDVRQTLVYCRRPDTPPDVHALFPRQMRLIELAAPHGRGPLAHLLFMVQLTQELARLLADDLPDVVHLHSSKAGFVGRVALRAIAARGGPRVRTLYSPHGLAYLNPNRPWSSAAYWALERFAGLFGCQPVGCGLSEADALTRLARRPAIVLENPVEPHFFEVQHAEPERPVIVTVGRVCEQKGPELFAELAVRVRLDSEDARFVWVGAGDPEREAMLRAVDVEVTGWLPQEEVRARLGAATVYVQTSRWEGLPLSVLQAMAVGVPCVVLDAVGNRDAVAHDETGFVAGDVDELEMYLTLLLGSPGLRHHFGRRARERAMRRFTLPRFRAAITRVYELDAHAPAMIPVAPASLSPMQPQSTLSGRNAPATLS